MPRLDQLPPTEESRPRKTFCRVLQGIVTLGYHVDPRRLGSVLAKALVMVVGAIARLEAPASSWPMWSAGQYLPGTGEEREPDIIKSNRRLIADPKVPAKAGISRHKCHLRQNSVNCEMS